MYSSDHLSLGSDQELSRQQDQQLRDLELLMPFMHSCKYRSGDTIITEGEAARTIYWLIKG